MNDEFAFTGPRKLFGWFPIPIVTPAVGFIVGDAVCAVGLLDGCPLGFAEGLLVIDVGLADGLADGVFEGDAVCDVGLLDGCPLGFAEGLLVIPVGLADGFFEGLFVGLFGQLDGRVTGKAKGFRAERPVGAIAGPTVPSLSNMTPVVHVVGVSVHFD